MLEESLSIGYLHLSRVKAAYKWPYRGIYEQLVHCKTAMRRRYLHSSNDAPPLAACGKQGNATKQNTLQQTNKRANKQTINRLRLATGDSIGLWQTKTVLLLKVEWKCVTKLRCLTQVAVFYMITIVLYLKHDMCDNRNLEKDHSWHCLAYNEKMQMHAAYW